VPAPLVVHAAAKLSHAQEQALALAVTTLPDAWRVVVNTEDLLHEGDRFSVRITGEGFAIVSGFAAATRPEQLAAFVERTRRDRHPQR
jgi:hypothetical protein